jgi:hypothetical protein
LNIFTKNAERIFTWHTYWFLREFGIFANEPPCHFTLKPSLCGILLIWLEMSIWCLFVGLTSLVSLNMSNSRVSNSGLHHLKPLKNLRSLTLESCKVTATELKKIQLAALPNLINVRPEWKIFIQRSHLLTIWCKGWSMLILFLQFDNSGFTRELYMGVVLLFFF